MHSLFVVWMSGSFGVGLGRMVQVPTVVVTPAPSMSEVELGRRQDPDAISFAEILLTAVPESLRQIAATNVPAVSSILWEQFLDDKRPEWFSKLPWDVQVYLIERFGPATALVPASPTGPVNPSATAEIPSHPVETDPSQPAPTVPRQPVRTGSSQATKTGPSQTQYGSSGVTQSTQVATSPSTTLVTTNTKSSTSGTSGLASTGTGSPSTTSSTAAKSTSVPDAPAADPADDEGLSRARKIGIGLGVPFGIIAAAALLFGCCTLLRRHHRKKVDGSIPPSSPGFIPRFAFQEQPAHEEPEERLLNPNSSTSVAELPSTTWDDEPIYDISSSGELVPTLNNNSSNTSNPYRQPQPQLPPIVAPALFHTHSSNRARGKRTSCTSLHSVAEVSEPGEDSTYPESPVLPRESLLRHPQPVKRHSPPWGFMSTLPVRAPSQIIRNPPGMGNVVKPPPPPPNNPAAHAASQSLLHQTMMAEQNPTSHWPPLATQMAQQQDQRRSSSSFTSPYVSPLEEYSPYNAFPSYEEDYGLGYSHQGFTPQHPAANPQMSQTHAYKNDDSVDISDGLYGGNTSLSRYPSLKASSSKTDCPFKNLTGSKHKKNKSPKWEQIYKN